MPFASLRLRALALKSEYRDTPTQQPKPAIPLQPAPKHPSTDNPDPETDASASYGRNRGGAKSSPANHEYASYPSQRQNPPHRSPRGYTRHDSRRQPSTS